jgi:hypothetical protein
VTLGSLQDSFDMPNIEFCCTVRCMLYKASGADCECEYSCLAFFVTVHHKVMAASTRQSQLPHCPFAPTLPASEP